MIRVFDAARSSNDGNDMALMGQGRIDGVFECAALEIGVIKCIRDNGDA